MQHVDKMETHAASVIINIAQLDVREPWPLEIFDHAGRMHDVTMAEGDILYYESAKNIHSRVRPFDGGRFANLFAHYRPGIDNGEGRNILVGDDEWFTRTNPTGTIWNLLRPDTEEHAELMASTDDAGKMQVREVLFDFMGVRIRVRVRVRFIGALSLYWWVVYCELWSTCGAYVVH